ncbi:Ribosomal large subunit pseudouridine synthase B [Kingella kingae]|uniref:pseudouridine synthase n=1 Tax=Kingella kingae TaxID=504 RepID=UPI000E079D7B|nr:pseudouridine synthase [Kingella kingae]QIP47765.1 rRNA pseudouridine synthase [Kingella kingae]STR03507.1 Ribosomal large subunit pseudouridine synthase B [Kingella kingae]
MSKNQPQSKREFRDGVSSKKPARKPQKPVSSSLQRPYRAENESAENAKPRAKRGAARHEKSYISEPKEYAAMPKQRASKARKLVVRAPNQKMQERVQELREKRTDLSRIEPERLQKVLAASGVGSRREMEEWINNGWVQVNGRVATLGEKVSPDDQVTVKGSAIKLKWADRLPRIILYYKQEGEIVSRDDPQGRVSIFDRLPQAASSRWVAIGRLDINTSGLLILTTSGELVQRFAHPSFEVEREYAVRVLGELSPEQMNDLCEGVMLEDGLAKVERIYEQGGEGVNKWYNVIIKEGRNREVRRLFESQGVTVSRLVRVGFGPIGLPNRLKRGQFYELNPAEVANILKWADMLLPGERRRRK